MSTRIITWLPCIRAGKRGEGREGGRDGKSARRENAFIYRLFYGREGGREKGEEIEDEDIHLFTVLFFALISSLLTPHMYRDELLASVLGLSSAGDDAKAGGSGGGEEGREEGRDGVLVGRVRIPSSFKGRGGEGGREGEEGPRCIPIRVKDYHLQFLASRLVPMQ